MIVDQRERKKYEGHQVQKETNDETITMRSVVGLASYERV